MSDSNTQCWPSKRRPSNAKACDQLLQRCSGDSFGRLTKAEQRIVSYLDGHLGSLSPELRSAVLKCASIVDPSSVPKDLAEEINKYGGKLGTDTAGVPEPDIEVARRTGCTKVNIDTDLRMAMTAAIRKVFFENPKEFDPRKYLGPSRTKVKELVRHKIKNVLCSAGHAFD